MIYSLIAILLSVFLIGLGTLTISTWKEMFWTFALGVIMFGVGSWLGLIGILIIIQETFRLGEIR